MTILVDMDDTIEQLLPAWILMTAPHNKSYDAEANGMIRVNGWDEIEEVIAALEHEQFIDVAQKILDRHKTAFEQLALD